MATLAELGIVGSNPILDYGISRAMGEDNSRAMTGAVGSTAGMLAGGLVAGIPGAVAGQFLGGWTADRIFDALNPQQKAQVLLNQHLNQIPMR